MIKIINRSYNDTKVDQSAEWNENLGILNFGRGNAFPTHLISEIEFSSCANACLSAKHKFVRGGGFENEFLNTFLINRSEVISKVDNKISQDLSFFDGAYVLLTFNFKGVINEIRHLPFENTRIGKIDEFGNPKSFKYSPKWGHKGDEENPDADFITEYDALNLDKEYILEKIKTTTGGYSGQVVYLSFERPSKRIYPVPFWYSAINWIGIDAAISEFHKNNIDNEFLLSYMIKMVGDPDELLRDAEGKETKQTKGEAFNEYLTTQFAGTKKGGKTITLWSDDSQNFPSIEAFPNSNNEKLFIAMEELTKKNIVQAFGIPNLIANIETAGKLGGSDEINNAVALFNGNTEMYRTLREEMWELILQFYKTPYKGGVKIKEFEFKNIANANNTGGFQGASSNF